MLGEQAIRWDVMAKQHNLSDRQATALAHIPHKREGYVDRDVRSELQRRGFRFRKHVKDLPGKPTGRSFHQV